MNLEKVVIAASAVLVVGMLAAYGWIWRLESEQMRTCNRHGMAAIGGGPHRPVNCVDADGRLYAPAYLGDK